MSEASRDRAESDESKTTISLAAPSWILLGLLALTPPLFATAFPNFESFKEVVLIGGVGVALILWGIQAIRQRAVTMMAGRVSVLLLVFGVYALAATLWADNQLLGVWDSLHFVALAAVGLIVTSPVGRPIRFYDFGVASGLGAAIAGIFGLLDLAGLGIFTPVWDPPGATAAFDSMELAVAYYVVALPVLLGAAFRFRGKSRIFFIACFGLAGFHFALMATWLAAAIFAGVCAAAVLVVVAFQRTQSMLVLIPVIVLLGALGVFMAITQWGMQPPGAQTDATSLPRLLKPAPEEAGAVDDPNVRNPTFSAQRVESVRGTLAHKYLFQVGSDLFAEQPLIGHGAGSWWHLQTQNPNIDHPYVEAMFEHYPAFRSPHNGAIKLMVEYGIIGLVLFVLWLVAAFAVTLGALGRRPERAGWILEHWALFCAGLAGLVFMLFTPLLESAPAALTWVAGLAVLTRFSASLNDFRGWSAVWSARAGADGSAFNAVSAGAVVAILVGLGMLVPTVANGVSSYHRGHGDHMMLRTIYTQAIDQYESAHAWWPAYGDVPYNIGLAATRIGELEEHEAFVREAARMRPYDTRALVLLGRVELGTRNTVEPIRLGKRAVDAFPNNVQATDLLVSAYDMAGRYEAAVKAAVELLEREPPRIYRAQLHLIVADLYMDMMKRPSQALDHYRQALRFVQSSQQAAELKKKVQDIEAIIEDQRRMREGKPPKRRTPPPGQHPHPH